MEVKEINATNVNKYHCTINTESENSSHSIILNYVTNDSTVLDVGCACGDMGYALKKYKNCTIYGFEYDKDSIVIANELKCYEELHQIDLNKLYKNSYKHYGGLFDYIICGDVLEHLYDPKEVLRVLRTFLKKDGYFIISLPNISNALIKAQILTDNFIYTDTGLLDRTHIRFFSHKTIPTFLAENNLLIEDFQCTYNFIESFDINPYMNIKSSIKQCIFKNKHSYIYQYVMKVKYNNSLNIKQCSEKNNVLSNILDSSILERVKKNAIDSKYVKKDYYLYSIFNIDNNILQKFIEINITENFQKFIKLIYRDGFFVTLKKTIKYLIKP